MSDMKAAYRALVVEDDQMMMGFMSDALLTDEAALWEIMACSSAEAACRRLADFKDVDVASIDIRLPGMDGVAFMRWLKQRAPGIPAVVVSGTSDVGVVLECLEVGAADYVMKPFGPESYRRALKRAAELKRLGLNVWPELELSHPVTGWVEISAPSECEFLFRFRQFSRLLLEAEFQPRDIEDLRLAIDELLHNAIEWGNQYDRKKQVKVTFCMFSDRVVVKVEDQGEGFVPEDIADPSRDPITYAEERRKSGKRPGGYGIHLVKAVTDEVLYNRRGNAVLFAKYKRL